MKDDGFLGVPEITWGMHEAYLSERCAHPGCLIVCDPWHEYCEEHGQEAQIAHPRPQLHKHDFGETFPEIIKDPRRALYHALKLLEEAGPIPGARIDWRDRCAMLLREWET